LLDEELTAEAWGKYSSYFLNEEIQANIQNEQERKFYQNNYSTVKNKCDLYSIFTEKAKSLLKDNGLLGFIFPNSWMGTESFSKFREFLSKEVNVYQLVELPPGVFEDAIVTTVLCFYQNVLPQASNNVEVFYCIDKEFIKKDFVLSYEQIPIPIIDMDAQQPFITLADTMLSLNSNLQDKRSRFLSRLSEELGGVKITTALQQFDHMTFAELKAELKKQKLSIPLKQQDEWEDFFNQRVAECRELSAQIKTTDEEIDNKVFDLYGLTEEERRIVMEG
jgi:hypothetical protein